MTPPAMEEVEAVQEPFAPRRAWIQISVPEGRLTWKATFDGAVVHPDAESAMTAPVLEALTWGVPALAVKDERDTTAVTAPRLAQVLTW